MRDFGGAVCAVPAISRAIPSDVFDGLKSDRWNSVDSALVWGWAELELRAKLRGLVVAMVLVPQGHCSASLPLQCCAIWCIGLVSSASLAFSVQRVARLKPLSPLRPGFRGGGFMWVRKSSPCGAVSSRKRERVRPARLKHPKFGVFVLAGRVFSRKGRWGRRAGRVLSRKGRWRRRAGRDFSRRLALRPGLVGDARHH